MKPCRNDTQEAAWHMKGSNQWFLSENPKGTCNTSRAICINTQWVNRFLFVFETRLTSSFLLSLFQEVSSPAFVFDSRLLASLKEDPDHDDMMWQRFISISNLHYSIIHQKNLISDQKHFPNQLYGLFRCGNPLTKRGKLKERESCQYFILKIKRKKYDNIQSTKKIKLMWLLRCFLHCHCDMYCDIMFCIFNYSKLMNYCSTSVFFTSWVYL